MNELRSKIVSLYQPRTVDQIIWIKEMLKISEDESVLKNLTNDIDVRQLLKRCKENKMVKVMVSFVADKLKTSPI